MLILSAEVATNPLQITGIGVVIAVLFLISILAVLGWMLRLPKETERTRTAARVVRSVNKQTRILVPLLNKSEATDRIVAIAAQMARYRDGEVDLLAVLEVPFTLPLDAHVEQDEKHALEVLERAEAVAHHCGTRNGVRVRKRILKARKAGVAIVHEAEDQAADLILIANASSQAGGSASQVDPAVDYVMRNAPCEVLVFSQGYAQTTRTDKVEEELERPAVEAEAVG
jgi:nucleotide-binding universal stress UspA family protein